MSIDAPSFDQTATHQAGDNTFRFVLNVFFEHWMLISLSTFLLSIFFGGFALMTREVPVQRYRTFADVVFMPSQWEKDILRDVSGITLAVTPRSIVERTSVRALAEGVALAMVQRDIAEGGPLSTVATKEDLNDTATSIEGMITLVPLDDSGKIRIEVANSETAHNAELVADFASRVFLEMNRQIRLEEGRETHDFIKEKLAELQQQLFEAETKEWKYKQEAGFRDIGNVDEEMAGMYEELNKIHITREEITAKLEELSGSLDHNTEALPESLDQVTDGVVDTLFLELDTLLQQKLSMSAIYQPEFPGIIELEEEISEKQQTILEALRQLDTGISGGSSVWKQRQEIYRQSMDLRLEITRLDVRSSTLERMLEEMMPRIPELANKNLQYEQLVQETSSVRSQFNKLRQREWDIRTALSHGAGQVERFDPVQRASVMMIGGSATRVWVNFVIGAIAGFVCAFCLVMMKEANDTSIRSIEDVTQYIGLEVIGTIPEMRFGRPRGGRRRRATYVTTVDEEQIDACIVTQHDPKSPISEAYRTLRTNYQFATINEKPRTVMVTSAVPGEGKTTTAANMAVTMADRGIRVLIVDTDLRRPNVHRVLRMERGPGLADVLREGLDPKSVIRPTRIDNLWIISSGRVPPNPSELIGSERMAHLMEQLGGEFDLVICDAPSVLVVTDPVLLATHVETCIMVVSTNNARRETVIRAKKLLETANVNVTGVVLNGLETSRRHYYYYYYYYDDGSPVRRKWYHFY